LLILICIGDVYGPNTTLTLLLRKARVYEILKAFFTNLLTKFKRFTVLTFFRDKNKNMIYSVEVVTHKGNRMNSTYNFISIPQV